MLDPAGLAVLANLDLAQIVQSRGITVVASNKCRKERFMLDIAMLALVLGFFVLSIGYAYACERF